MLKRFRDHEVFWPATILTSVSCAVAITMSLSLGMIKWHYLIPYSLVGFIWTLRLFWYDAVGPREYADERLFCEYDGLFIYAAGLLVGTIGWPCFLVYVITSKIDSVKPVNIAEKIKEKKNKLQNSEISPTDKER